MSDTKTCVFCDIIAGKCPETRVEYSNDNIVIFKDIKPASDYHYLAVPKAHMENVRSLNENQRDLIREMQEELRNLLREKNIDIDDISYGFHWPPFTSIDHLHMHAIAPASKMRFIAKIIFMPINIWYCTPEYVCSKLKPIE